MSFPSYDFVVVGAGIVGLTVARELKLRAPSARIAVLDKEERIGLHASGRNSGVLHSGIYYAHDSLKARVCARGARRMAEFAAEHGIPVSRCGKIILATSDVERSALVRLMGNARENGINAHFVDDAELRELEPAAAEGVAIHCPDTAVIDSRAVLERLRALLEQQGVAFILGTEAYGSGPHKVLRTAKETVSCGFLFNCAGAHADTLAKSSGLAGDYALVPFKGLYWKLSPGANHLVRANIYPVPDAALPFLGVHLTRVINGDVYVGPTAIPALGRENYGGISGMRIGEALSTAARLASMYWGNQNNFRLLAHMEMAKYGKQAFLAAATRLVPTLKADDLVPASKVGIRPQLVNVKTGRLEMDYILQQTDTSIHVLNAISPAFTSSLAFAELIVEQSRAI